MEATHSDTSPASPVMSDAGYPTFHDELLATWEATKLREEQRRYDDDMAGLLRVPLIHKLAADLEEIEERSPETLRIYGADCKRFKKFCDIAGTSCLPASPELVCHFLLHESEDQGATKSVINRIRCAIGYVHRIKQLPDPTDHPLVRATIRYIARLNPTDLTDQGTDERMQ
jgi:hypothetical protein